jgi:hypothetical protein
VSIHGTAGWYRGELCLPGAVVDSGITGMMLRRLVATWPW